jgi:hypothetical protein
MLLIALALAQAAPFDVKADYSALARTHCRREWPDDFRMQDYCFTQQVQGMAEFKAASEAIGKPLERALEKCVEEWTKDRIPDFQMIGYCAKTQAESYRRVNERG